VSMCSMQYSLCSALSFLNGVNSSIQPFTSTVLLRLLQYRARCTIFEFIECRST
jgi:hypothetical protein